MNKAQIVLCLAALAVAVWMLAHPPIRWVPGSEVFAVDNPQLALRLAVDLVAAAVLCAATATRRPVHA